MGKGRFVKELIQMQDYYMILQMNGEEIIEEKFPVRSIQFSLQADEETYKREYFRSADFRGLLHGISIALGVGVYCAPNKIAVEVSFPNNGFWCYESFYGEMLKIVEERLKFQSGGSIPIDRKKKPKEIPIVLIEDMDS